jgi:hypothetical protein
VFGAVAALAALLIALQAISRQLRDADGDLTVLRALGAGPTTIAADALMGILGALVIGSLLAVVVAVALSPLSPLGPVRPVYPGSPVAFDWIVLGFGLLVLIGCLGAIAVALAYRGAPHRVARRSQLSAPGFSKAVAAVSLGLPAPAVVGVRFALDSGRGRTAVPVRSGLLGAVLAVALVVTTLTFGSGLRSLGSHPALYGWDWSYMMDPSNIVSGRWLWTLFAQQIYAVPQPSVPVLSVALVALGALVLANVVAGLPGRNAARTPTALLLRAE